MNRTSVLHFCILLLFFTVGCGADVGADGNGGHCGKYSYLPVSGVCECISGYSWCDPNDPNNQNCCQVESGCGNAICEPVEDSNTCPADCVPGVVCGDGICDESEASTFCPADCGPTVQCGNNQCEQGETRDICPSDCEIVENSCGNGICDPSETQQNCPADCAPPPPLCGNATCEIGENTSNCSIDCPPLPCADFSCAKEICYDVCDYEISCIGNVNPNCYQNCDDQIDFIEERLDPRFKPFNCASSIADYFSCWLDLSCTDLSNPTGVCAREATQLNSDCQIVPTKVDITLISAIVSPRGSDGCIWDGPGCSPIPQDVIDEVSRLLAQLVGAATAKIPILSSDVFQSLAAELISYMISSYLTSIEPPDMKGEIVYSDWDTTDTTRTFSETSNSYKPSLGPTTIRGLDLWGDTQIVINLWDVDAVFDDYAGQVVLGYEDIRNAWIAGGNAWVLTGTSVYDTILQVQMRVVEAQ